MEEGLRSLLGSSYLLFGLAEEDHDSWLLLLLRRAAPRPDELRRIEEITGGEVVEVRFLSTKYTATTIPLLPPHIDIQAC